MPFQGTKTSVGLGHYHLLGSGRIALTITVFTIETNIENATWTPASECLQGRDFTGEVAFSMHGPINLNKHGVCLCLSDVYAKDDHALP